MIMEANESPEKTVISEGKVVEPSTVRELKDMIERELSSAKREIKRERRYKRTTLFDIFADIVETVIEKLILPVFLTAVVSCVFVSTGYYTLKFLGAI
jgi:hypothetical protein